MEIDNDQTNDRPAILLDGTQPGSGQYFAFGRRGAVALAVKCLAVSPYPAINVAPEGSQALILRVRSAEAKGELATLDDETVKTFGFNMGLAESWPAMRFEKVDEDRASAVIFAQVNAILHKDAWEFETKMKEEHVIEGIVDFLLGIVGQGEVITTKAALMDHIQKQFDVVIERSKRQQKIAKALDTITRGLAGTVFTETDVRDKLKVMLPEFFPTEPEEIEGTPPDLPDLLH